MTTLIGYARVSTSDQDHALQLDALGKAGCERIFTETISGALRDRPELENLMRFVRAGDTLVIWRLDRLGRSLKDLIAIVEALDERGVAFRSLRESIDTTTAGGRLVFHVFGALAEFERELMRERTCAGLEAARARGKVGGRPPALTEEQIAVAREMHDSGGYTATAIAKTLGVGRATIYRHLGQGKGVPVEA